MITTRILRAQKVGASWPAAAAVLAGLITAISGGAPSLKKAAVCSPLYCAGSSLNLHGDHSQYSERASEPPLRLLQGVGDRVHGHLQDQDLHAPRRKAEAPHMPSSKQILSPRRPSYIKILEEHRLHNNWVLFIFELFTFWLPLPLPPPRTLLREFTENDNAL